MRESREQAHESPGSAPSAAELIDVCVVGGGIAGVVAALRAQELGLTLRLVEAGTLFHACALEAEDSSGESAEARPPANSVLDLTRGAPPVRLTRGTIEAWNRDVIQREIPCFEGAHVFAIEREKHGTYCLRISEASMGRERRLRSRAVLIATGSAGGDTSDSETPAVRTVQDVVDRAVLVLGANAEAIATLVEISDAKARAGVAAPVSWCPRLGGEASVNDLDAGQGEGTGLGDRFLAASLRNQNIQSLPAAYRLNEEGRVGLEGREGRVVLEMSSAQSPDAAASQQRFEFDGDCVFRFDSNGRRVSSSSAKKEPEVHSGWELLSSLSVRVDRRDNESLLVLDVAGRLSHPGLYAAGAVRGADYLLCSKFGEDTSATPASGVHYERVRRSQSPEFAAGEAVASVDAIARSLGRYAEAKPAIGVPPPSRAVAAISQAESWQLVRLRSDGSPGSRFEISGDVTEIGRAGGQVEEPDDEHMAEHHASLVRESGEFFIADSGNGSGVWLRISSADGHELENEDQVWLGAQILVAAKSETSWTVVHYGSDGSARETYAVDEAGIFVGRGSGHVLDPSDGLLSRRHAQLCVEHGKLKIYDRGARNGTYVKVSGAVAIESGAEFRISTKGYRFERVGDASRGAAGVSEVHGDAAAHRGGEVELQDVDHPRNFPVAAGHTILQGFIESRGAEGEPLAWECQTGTCGLCVVEVVSGGDNVVPSTAAPDEMHVIETTLGAASERKNLRLACLARVEGSVVLRTRS